jgi:LPXTG-site transpeptidase (sortase) family protein
VLKILIIIILFCSGCTKTIKYEKIENKLVIDKIDINNNISVSSINEDINGIVMFSEYGRPNIENSNTIIGAHSGSGNNSYFNLLDTLDIGDEILILYNGIKYKYIVKKVYEVDYKDISPLNSNLSNALTLMTCKLNDSSKRIIVIASK